MIDKHDEVFDRVSSYVISKHPSLTSENFADDYVNAPSKFPHIEIVQTDSYTRLDSQDNTFVEKAVTLLFEVTVYSNKQAGKRAECRDLMKDVDDYMHRLNMTRESMSFVDNMANNSIARLVARYRVIADENNFYRR